MGSTLAAQTTRGILVERCVSPIRWSCGRRSREGKWSRSARKVHSLENRPLDSSTEDASEVFGGPPGRAASQNPTSVDLECACDARQTTLWRPRHTKRPLQTSRPMWSLRLSSDTWYLVRLNRRPPSRSLSTLWRLGGSRDHLTPAWVRILPTHTACVAS